MSGTTRLGLAALGAAAVLGLLGDALLRALPWGLNALLWAAALAVAAALLLRLEPARATGSRAWPLALFVLFASALAWRASPTLAVLNVLAALTAFALAAVRTERARIWLAGLADLVSGFAWLVVSLVVGALAFAFDDVRWQELPRSRWSAHAGAFARGLAIAVPLLVVFGTLFVAADAAFEGIVVDLLDPGDLPSHVLVFLLWALVAGGLLRYVLMPREDVAGRPDAERVAGGRLGIVELGTALATLNALFLAFVLVQFRYLFGGDERVQTVADLTYAEYARRGFFELVAVAALVLPLLLVGEWLLRRERPRDARIFRALAATLVLLLFVVLASALERLRLYTDAYGLTELRLYSTAFVVWLGLVFAWLLVTVLRGRGERFAFGGVVAGFLVVLALDAVNPDALIARTNLERDEGAVDVGYLLSLSGDAAPTLAHSLDELPSDDQRRRVSEHLLRTWAAGDDDWRTWNWSRARAREAVSEQRAALERHAP